MANRAHRPFDRLRAGVRPYGSPLGLAGFLDSEPIREVFARAETTFDSPALCVSVSSLYEAVSWRNLRAEPLRNFQTRKLLYAERRHERGSGFDGAAQRCGRDDRDVLREGLDRWLARKARFQTRPRKR